MDRKRSRSKYSAYFDRDGEMGLCRLCPSKIPWSKSGGTNCIRLHLATKHPVEMNEFKLLEEARAKMSRPSVEDFNNSTIENSLSSIYVKEENVDLWRENSEESNEKYPAKNPSYKHTDQDQLVFETILGDRWPVENVEGEFFRRLLRKLKPGFELKSVEHYVNLVLPSFRSSLESRILTDLKFAGKISLVFDYGSTAISGLDCVSVMEYRRLQNLHGSNPYYAHFLNIEFSEYDLSSESLQRPEFMSWTDHWGLLYFLLDTQIPQVLSNFCATTKQANCPELTPDELLISKFMYSILMELKSARNSIRNQSYPTASVIIPTLRVLLHKSDTTSFIKSQVISDLQNVSTICQNNEILKTATFFDPRFRDRYFFESHKEKILATYREFADKNFENKLSISKEEKPNQMDLSSFDLFLQSQGPSKPTEVPGANLEKEIAEYLQEEPNSQLNPIDYWIFNQSKLPILKTLAAQFSAIPASANSKSRKIYEDGDKIFSMKNMDSIKEDFGFCCANLEVDGVF
ncbi:Protein CBG26704 [Caenorhabditis briggsae]|uniref:Protein CBG26704 n=1 Tax=Caenorhabditis briggsae TaxID=6238 RepID=B6IE74_CAEBR|nr:Protein CBG26704 [Caenorhabditis briggsae]CAS01138.1 Protein CBG26704 [Caenorhabditis briggsae]